MKMITFYKINGDIVESKEFDSKTKNDFHGMKIKCTLNNGNEKIGFANSYYSMETDDFVSPRKAEQLNYIVLETFINLDEETHKLCGTDEHKYDVEREKVDFSEIVHIDAILHSGIRWGGIITNKFIFRSRI